MTTQTTYNPLDAEATVNLLVVALAGVPALPGARCRGRAHLFDAARQGESPEHTEARHTQAIGLCRTCPALAACTAWASHLTAGKRPAGAVIAGAVIDPPRPRGRPKPTSTP